MNSSFNDKYTFQFIGDKRVFVYYRIETGITHVIDEARLNLEF